MFRKDMRVAVVAAVLLLGWSSASQAQRGAGGPRLEDLNDIRELHEQFNRDKGNIRVVLLLSPM